MSWSEKYKRSIDCENPKGFSQKAHCLGRKKRLKEQFKSFKTPEQIAKKHRLSVSFIKRQLKMGEPIEHEHTKNHKLAREIALQHLEEIPDYYTRLKKMEADAKKHHNKFKDVKEHCGCEEDAVKDLEVELKKLKDVSYDSIDKLMRRIMKQYDMTARQLHDAFVNKHDKTPDEWIENLKEETKSGDQGLRDWFKKSKSSDGKPGWVQLGGKWAGKPCARQPGQTSTPKCGSSKMASELSPEEEEKARRRKNRQDPNQPEKTGGAKPTNVRTEQMDIQEVKDKPGKGSGKKDACYNKVKSRYDVWPSAYASGALVKCRKVGAANWGNKSENYSLSDWRTELMEKKDPCWKGYRQAGMKKKGNRIVPNCVPEQTEMIRYCPKCDKNETRSECSYGVQYWDMFSLPAKLGKKYDPNKPHPANEEKDHEHSMARSELSTVINAAKRLKKKMKGEGNIEAWVQSKITKAADYLDSAADYVDSGEMKAEDLSFKVDHQAAQRPSSAATKIRNMSTAQQAQLPKEKVKKVIGTDLPRFGESISIEDANGNTFANVIDIIGPDHMKPVVDSNGVWKGSRQECVSEQKTFRQFMEAIDKSKMKCNSPKAEPVGDSETGKSHVVKACEGGKEKIIRFGQRGVKGSPKKKGESEAYASRRHRFQTRHAKNIAKGKMSAAYWANKVKW
jgi:hypothetical protein